MSSRRRRAKRTSFHARLPAPRHARRALGSEGRGASVVGRIPTRFRRTNVKNKVAVIGGGNVGANAALFVAERGLADVTLIDIVDGLPQGKSLDLQQAAPLWHQGARLEGSPDLAAVKGADVVVMTAGFPRKP